MGDKGSFLQREHDTLQGRQCLGRREIREGISEEVAFRNGHNLEMLGSRLRRLGNEVWPALFLCSRLWLLTYGRDETK